MTSLEILADTVEGKFVAAAETMLGKRRDGAIRADYLAIAAQLAPIATTLRALSDREKKS